MHGKLLIVNSFHPQARYVPMGSFGLCHHLEQTGHQARIWNGALYPPGEQLQRLSAECEQFQPTAIGLILQWKEYTENALGLARELKQQYPEQKLVVGGITAGYFAETLLRRYHFIDGVIRGDAEVPMQRLLDGEAWPRIPNLLFRGDDGTVQTGAGRFHAGCDLLNRLSFTRLDHYMVDHHRYLQVIEPVLASFLPAMSNAVPWSGLVRMIGRPSVQFTALSQPSSLTGINPWS